MTENTKKKAKRTRKIDPELAKKIKEMEQQKREEAQSNAEIKIVTGDAEDDKMGFDQWWMLLNRKKPMKSWMKEIIKVDFKARGLSNRETKENYYKALELFGVKL